MRWSFLRRAFSDVSVPEVTDVNQITIAPLPSPGMENISPTTDPIGSARGLPDGDALDLSITAVTHRDSHVSENPRDSRDVIRT